MFSLYLKINVFIMYIVFFLMKNVRVLIIILRFVEFYYGVFNYIIDICNVFNYVL